MFVYFWDGTRGERQIIEGQVRGGLYSTATGMGAASGISTATGALLGAPLIRSIRGVTLSVNAR